MLSGWVGARFAKEDSAGTEPELSLETDPLGDPGVTRLEGRGVE